MAAEAAPAPSALSAREIDFADNALSDEIAIVRHHDFTNELMPGGSGESVVSTEQFQIRVTDSAAQQADQRISARPPRLGNIP